LRISIDHEIVVYSIDYTLLFKIIIGLRHTLLKQMGSQEGREGERNVDVVVLFLAVDVGVNCFVMHNAHNRVFLYFNLTK
jgi:hypothetical protein